MAEYVLNHHERWDGRGYPNGRTGESIPLLSRILSIADAYDAMTEDRIYRPALPRENALKEIEKMPVHNSTRSLLICSSNICAGTRSFDSNLLNQSK